MINRQRDKTRTGVIVTTQLARAYNDAEIMSHLPHPQARPGQIKAVRLILESFDQGKRFVFLEAPTGSGKSALGLTVAGFHDNSYYLTIQKILQDQISRDYAGAQMVELKGRNAYPCTFYDLHGQTLVSHRKWTLEQLQSQIDKGRHCDDGYCCRQLQARKCQACFPRIIDQDTGAVDQRWLDEQGVHYSTCPYYEQVGLAMHSPKVLMNFSSFLYQTNFTPRFRQRNLLIIDEGHHCEGQLMDFVSVTIDDRDFIAHGLELPELEETVEYAIWLLDKNIPALLIDMLEVAKRSNNLKREEETSQTQKRVNRFLRCVEDGMTDWVHEYRVHQSSGVPTHRSVTIKPIFVSHFAQDLLWKYGSRVLIMSATILDANVMAKALGIKRDEMVFHRMPNNFPVANRPIYLIPAVKATGGKGNQHVWGADMVRWVDGIVRRYPGKRGIIHTHNFSIANMLLDKCRERKRFLFQESFRDKLEMLQAHTACQDSVLVAPAMHEGLDLRDDLSRFQIICKTPYPNFFDDKQLAARIENDRRFLIWLVALKLVQSYGRSIRSAEDWAHTYIIDSAVKRFLVEANRMLPDWFKEALIDVPIKG